MIFKILHQYLHQIVSVLRIQWLMNILWSCKYKQQNICHDEKFILNSWIFAMGKFPFPECLSTKKDFFLSLFNVWFQTRFSDLKINWSFLFSLKKLENTKYLQSIHHDQFFRYHGIQYATSFHKKLSVNICQNWSSIENLTQTQNFWTINVMEC